MKFEVACCLIARLCKTLNTHNTTAHHKEYVKNDHLPKPTSKTIEPRSEHNVKCIVIYTDKSKLESGGMDFAFVA